MTANIPKELRIVRESPGRAARLYIDGELFDIATVDGFATHPRKAEMPSVTVSIAAWSVVVEDSVATVPADNSP